MDFTTSPFAKPSSATLPSRHTVTSNRVDSAFVTDTPTDLGQYGLKSPQVEVSVFSGKDKVTMFEMNKHLALHLK